MNNIIIHPFKQLIVRRDPLSRDERYCLDKLNPNLSFRKEIAKAPESCSLDGALKYFIETGIIGRGTWIEVQQPETLDQAFKTAMEQLRRQATATG